MSSKKLVVLACLLLAIIGGAIAYFLSAKQQHAVIGLVGGHKIYEKDLTPQEAQSLFEARTQLYQAAENILAKKYFENILADYKIKHNLNDDLAAQQAYIDENIKIPDAQIQEFIKANADNPLLKGKSAAEQKQLVEPYLKQELIQSYFGSMIAKATDAGELNVLLLKKPVALSADIEISSTDPALGPQDAPVTIVEFADFQCPYCNAVTPTIQSVLKKYDGKIRFVFKNYPLVQIHAQAVNAAIAAKCAQEQNKYWEMHDKLFENYKNLSDTLYTKLASQLELDAAKFKSCQANPETRAQIMNDIEYGQSLGITATPAFYINGKQIMGAQPLSVFERTIDDALAKH